MAEALNEAFMRQLAQMFRAELDEHVQEMMSRLFVLEGMADSDEREECLTALFRSAHNIKGAARGVDAREVEQIAHALESLLGALKGGVMEPDAGIIDLCLSALDAMQLSLEPGASPHDLSGLLRQLEHRGEAAPPPEMAAPVPAAELPGADDGHDKAVARIAHHRLTLVTALVEELMAARIALDDEIRELQSSLPASAPLSAAWKGLRSCGNRVGMITERLQDQIRQMRMVPAASLLEPLARSVRDIARELGKKVDYEVVGGDFEMDRPVLEGIKDPLVHLLRNAVDHGIEPPSARLDAGKRESGRITVTVRGAGSRVQVAVSDDGGGIYPEKVADAAVRKQLLSPDEAAALTPDEIRDLIFRPGFSSSDCITDVSGRGVGLDIVLSNIRKMKGDVQVQSEPGKGTCFTLQLPLTLSVDRGLVVRAEGGMYVIPSTSVVRVMDIAAGDLVGIAGGQAMTFQGRAIPACELAAALELARGGEPPARWFGVVVQRGWQRIAFLVDDIIGEREIVIKRLKPPLSSVRNVTGGTLMGNGRILLVLNPEDLVLSALRLQEQGRSPRLPVPARRQVRRVLVVDDSITTRTLETGILEAQGYRVTTANDGGQAWQALQQESFDLVVTDAEMPGMTGFELTARIKRHPRLSVVPVVMVTSLAGDADRRRGVAAGVDAYVVKSRFESGALLDVIRHLIGRMEQESK
ncbi:MAG TPA: hybrid sensor histidine kinase/response regulator [Fluviicoccus sp.]|nr:hybrid sensor histidine kinase/response regulator [Fluviicoccus sp.]